MKVLKDNYNNWATSTREIKRVNPYPRTCLCECCGSELEYDESDVKVGEYGCAYIFCPLCNSESMLYDSEKELVLTKNNIEFPAHFHHTSAENGAVDICNNKEVKERIHNAIEYFRNNKDEYYWMTACGNLYIGVHRLDGDENYEVLVTKDYYETYIPFEKVDY